MLSSTLRRALPLLAAALPLATHAIDLEVTSKDSVSSASSKAAKNLMSFYTGYRPGDNPGNLPDPYHWWEAGAMFGHMVDYWYYTGDDQYNDWITQAITWQAGTSGTFEPRNQTKNEGNDDQVFWAFAAMGAAEAQYPAPPDDYPSWTAMAQAVFNRQAGRWDTEKCGGGLRWQIHQFNNGWNYKNSVSNGGFFQLSARLARYSGNETFTDWAVTAWEWFEGSVLYQTDSPPLRVFDGANREQNCSEPNRDQWTYNNGMYISGLAYLYNHTEDAKYEDALDKLLDSTFTVFFPKDKVVKEIGCEDAPSGCGTDPRSFKSYLLRWLAITTQLVPSKADKIWEYLTATGMAAAAQCDDAGDKGASCAFEWHGAKHGESHGVGEQMSALSAIQATMLKADPSLKAPLTLDTGGKSKGDADAGTEEEGEVDNVHKPSKWATKEITTGDKAGAGILTTVVLAGMLGGVYGLVS